MLIFRFSTANSATQTSAFSHQLRKNQTRNLIQLQHQFKSPQVKDKQIQSNVNSLTELSSYTGTLRRHTGKFQLVVSSKERRLSRPCFRSVQITQITIVGQGKRPRSCSNGGPWGLWPMAGGVIFQPP